MRVRMVLVGLTLVAILAAVGAYFIVHKGAPTLPVTLGRACEVTTSRGSVSLDADQVANAATISAVALRRKLPERAITVALATALQESKLRNLSYGDRDSLGLFQQRPSQNWGTEAQIQNPRYAAGEFYDALLKVRGWKKLRVTEAAQKVQRSAYPEAYQKWADEAAVMTDAFTGTAKGAVACTVEGEPSSRGAVAAQALDDDLRLDWGDLTTLASPEITSVVLSPATERAGWQLAHWLVAHAAESGVERVRFSSQEWTASRGGWTGLGAQNLLTGERVVADVFADA